MMALDHSDMKALAAGLAPVLHEHVKAALAPVLTRLAAVEARLVEAEQRGLAYAGVYQRAAYYQRGAVVTSGGSAWVALCAVEAGEAPGKSDSWQLMVKGGR